jgi:hypothetical protein
MVRRRSPQLNGELERELLGLAAAADMLVTVDPAELEKNTLVSLGVIISEACGKIRELAE